MPQQPRIALTGASGFLGQAIVKEAAARDIVVHAVTRDVSRVTSVRPGSVFAYDPHSGRGLAEAFASTHTVIHAAGIAHRPHGAIPDDQYMADNGQACRQIVETAAAAGVPQVVLVSSISVYGDTGNETWDESATCRPQGPYATSKLFGEQCAIEAGQRHGVHVTVLRLATIFGREDPGNFVRLIRAIDRRRFVWIGTGRNRKTLIHRTDAATACLLPAITTPNLSAIYNVAAGIYTLRDIVTTMASQLDRHVRATHIPEPVARLAAYALRMGGASGRRVATTLDRWLGNDAHSGDRFAQAFGFMPRMTLADGLADECAWYRQIHSNATA